MMVDLRCVFVQIFAQSPMTQVGVCCVYLQACYVAFGIQVVAYFTSDHTYIEGIHIFEKAFEQIPKTQGKDSVRFSQRGSVEEVCYIVFGAMYPLLMVLFV